MPRQLVHIVTESDQGMRLDALLAARDCYPSRSQAALHIEQGMVLVNGNEVSKKHCVCAGDTIVYSVEDRQKHIPLEGEDIPLDIRFEDDWLMVISKQAGLCVHPSPGHEDLTLVNALIHHYGRDNLAHVQGDDRPGIVHRLDMDTSGLIMCAKDDAVAHELQDQIRLREVDRRYISLVHGNIAYDTGQIDMPLARDTRERVRMRVMDIPSAREAVTTFHVLERFEAGMHDDGYSLIECKLYTGRTHQIRAHMEYIRHSCVGDPLYTQGSPDAQLGLTRQFLHSYSLSFDHPRTGAHLSFVDGLAPRLAEALDSLAERSMGRTPRGNELLSLLEHAQSQDVALEADMMAAL